MELSSILKVICPWIATALGGPLGGLALTAAADALGVPEKTSDAIKSALSGATPEQMLALKNADQSFELQMQALGFANVKDLEAIAAGDRADAREMQVANKSFMPALMTGVVCGMFGTALGMLFFYDVPVANKDIIVYMIGQLSGAFGASTAFWWGTTRQSEDKTHAIVQAAASKYVSSPAANTTVRNS